MPEIVKMSWRRWKIGLLAAIISTFLDAIIVSFADPSVLQHLKDRWPYILIGFVVVIAKAGAMWLKQHPIEEVADNTQIITKEGSGAV